MGKLSLLRRHINALIPVEIHHFATDRLDLQHQPGCRGLSFCGVPDQQNHRYFPAALFGAYCVFGAAGNGNRDHAFLSTDRSVLHLSLHSFLFHPPQRNKNQWIAFLFIPLRIRNCSSVVDLQSVSYLFGKSLLILQTRFSNILYID